ncbi:hypothetical protein [Methylobacterium radiotolerans]|nr:hypothetical protein [Methylobacterium radiotolerans]
MSKHRLRRALLLIAIFVTAIVTLWSVEHAPMRAYGAIERQGAGL